MDKVKIKNLVVNNKKRLVITLAILLISILLIGIITYATSNQDYVVEIKDNGSEHLATNVESSVTKKIVSETTKSLTYEVAINNLKTRSNNPEVAVLIDTSSSMAINDIETQVKPKAIEFVRGLLADVKGVKISISNNYVVKAGLGTVTTANYTSHINGLVAGQGSNLSDGIDKAISTFSTNENEKYLIIFSDATDPVLEKLQLTVNNGISVYSILTDMTNNEYTQNPETAVGKVQMISDIESFSPIYNKINNSIMNVKVKDIFTPETNEYFTLTEATSNPTDVIFTKTEDGYELDCANIKAGETKKVQFTLTLDENSNIDSGKVYRDLNTSSKMTINYDNHTGDKRNYETELSPIYIICQKYSLTIKAVSEKSDKLPVKDLEIKVVGKKTKDGEGNDVEPTVVFDKVLKTNDKGEILIDELKTLGTIEFEIKPNVNQIGYSETSATTIIVNNRPQREGITADADVGEKPIVNNTTRNIDVKLPIKTQTYEIKLETVDLNNSNIKLGNIEYRLIQPKLNSKYEMEALYATTDEQGNLTFRPSVMTKDGLYEYVLSQLTEQDGYTGIGNVTLYVYFENGKIKEKMFTHKHNENVETAWVSGTEGKVTIKNESENADTFRLEINVSDSENSEKKLQGAVYDIEATRVTSAGNQITNTVKGCITDENGQINLDLPGTGNVVVKIKEVNPKTGYHADTIEKEITFIRTDGRVQKIVQKNPIDINAVADSDANALIVNLTSVERSGKNRIQIHMIDNVERDINIPGVGLTLINLINNKTYTAVSDANGIANFLVDDEETGDYAYDIMLTNGVPYGYINSERKLGGISVHFNDEKFIDSCSDTSYTVPYFAPSYELMSEDFAYNTGKVDIGLTPDAANTYNFQIKLVDDKNKVIKDAKYDITIESGDIVRKITGRATDSNGMITTRLVGTDEVKITVKQTETIRGHIINTQEQIIELTRINGVYQITHQEPYLYDGNTQKIGAEISGKNIIYHDVNKEKTGNNTILNLYVNKKDINGNLVGGVKTVITSPTLKLAGKAITATTNYTATAKSGNVFTLNPAISNNDGYFEVEGIEVNGLELNDGERVDYLYMYELDANGKIIENTKITLKLTFRYNENKEIIQITNVEATWGNRLLSKRTFDGYETNVAYESNVYLDIYTNYDDVGNFALNLEKVDKNNNKLQGAKYDVVVTRVDGTRVVRRGIEITDSTEFEGFLVAEGTKIEITEVEAPIGYGVNEYTEILTIKSVDAVTGKMEVELEKSSYATPRAKLEPLQEFLLEDGTYKTEAKVVLTDYELDTFKFGIIAIDPVNTQTTPNYVPVYIHGYTFSISTSQGAQSETPETDENGKTSTLVGANYKTDNFIVKYKIDTLKAAKYYKKLVKPIEVIVVFDLNGEVKGQETRDANAANSATNGYGTIWDIEATKTTDGNDIDIKINIEPEDKLIVNVISQDRRSKASVTDNYYTITPALNGTGKGSQKIEVGYIVSDSTQTYTIHQDRNNPDYQPIGDQIFKIDYDKEGNVLKVYDQDGGPIGGTSNSGRIIKETHNGKEITLTIVIEPKITVNVISKDRRTKAIISNIEYAITPNEMSVEGVVSPINVGYSMQDGEVEYTLKQTNEIADYAMLEEQKFTVEYGNNDEIVDVKNTTSGIVNKTFTTNGTVTLTVELEPTISVKIISKDRISGNIVSTNTYKITPTDSKVDSNSVYDEITHDIRCKVGFAMPGEVIEYTIAQTNNSATHETLDNQTFKVEYDSNDNIIDVRDESDKIITKSFTNSEVELTLELEPILPVTVNIKSTDIITGKELYTTQIINGDPTKIHSMGYSIALKEYEEGGTIIKEHTQGQGTTKIKDERFTTGTTENGSNQLEFNCAIPDGEGTYVLKQTNELDRYVKLDDIEFKIEYDHEDNIKNATTDASNLVIISWNERTLDIEVKVEPGTPFAITNIGYFDNLPLSNGQFAITSAKPITKTTTTNNNGEAVAYVDKLGEGNTVRYGIKQTSAKIGYCTTEEFEIEVTYDENRYITDAKLIDGSPVNNNVTLVNVSYTSPSIEGNIGYNDNDRGIVNIEVKNYPAVQFEITNLNRVDGTTKISGTNYKVTSTTNEEAAGTTNPTAIVYLGRGAFSNTITYTIEETAPAARHQGLLEDIVIEVDFDEEGKVVDPPRVIKGGQIATAVAAGRASYADSLKVNVEIKSNPQLAIAIIKEDETIKLMGVEPIRIPGVDFEVTAQIKKDDLNNYSEEKLNKIMKDTAELSDEEYLKEALNRLKQTDDDIQNVKETIAIVEIVENLKYNNNLTAEQENEIMQGISYIQKANIIANMGKLTITQITQIVNAVTMQEVANFLVENGKTTQDAINDIVSDIKNLVRLDVDRVTTNYSGYAIAYLDKTLEDKTIEYTLKETKKVQGYDWPDEEVRFEVTYDENGKMVQNDPIKVVSGDFEITEYDINNFLIVAKVKNTPSKEVKIHVVAQDTYDSDKKLEVAKFNAHLIDPNSVDYYGRLTFAPDNKYKTTLSTGSVQNASGVTAHGEDTESLGIYKEGPGTRVLRLVADQTPGTYYKNGTAYSASYQGIPYSMLIQVSFNDEGRVTGASLYHPGEDIEYIGTIADGRYIEVTSSMNTIEITVKYYPMIRIQMVTKDMYTNSALQARYTISTNAQCTNNYNIKSGYINPHISTSSGNFGRIYQSGYTTSAGLNTVSGNADELYGAYKLALAPTEAEGRDSKVRRFYVYENQEPTSPMQYQKYRCWNSNTMMDDSLIAIIEVKYNEKGEIDRDTPPKIIETRSRTNIQSNFVELKAHISDDYTIQLTVKYAPITTISAKVIDAVSGQGIEGIRIDPYQYNSNVSNNSYEYRSNKYYITGRNGNTGWTYWGGSIASGKVYYQMSTSNYYSDIYMKSGYFNPGAILLEVLYDENGRVTTAAVKSTDQFGDPNAINISWDDRNHISITIPYQRQFLLNIGKVNYDDSTEKLSASRFRIESSKGVLTEFNGNSGNHVVGKVYPGKIVRYTITETQIPNGYTSVGTMYVDVEFNNNGTIRKQTSSEPDYYEFLNKISLENNVCTGMRINIKNKLAFRLKLDVRDEFYPTLGVQGATYEIKNDKGDNAAGTLVTDENGIIDVVVGTIYKNETVKYTIKQTNKANGYYINSQEIEVTVIFNKGGDINTVSITKGANVATASKMTTNQDIGIYVRTTNMPEDVKIGIEKNDRITGKPMDGIQFNVKTEPSGKVAKDYTLVTNADGKVTEVVDKFEKTSSYKKVKYTISEIQVPGSYRKIEDVQIEVTYKEDGSMYYYDVLSNPSGVQVQVATNRQIKAVNDMPVHIKLGITNDNAYDLIIKNTDRNFPGLGIEGTVYDVTINGEEVGPVTTNSNGNIRIPNRTESGRIEISITERKPGEGYRAEPMNTVTTIINKGTDIYSLALDPVDGNNNSAYATIVADEAHGTVTVEFKNETKLELKLVKDDINTGKLLEGAIFAITSEELDNTGNVKPGTLEQITNTVLTGTTTDDDGNNVKNYDVDEEEATDTNGLVSFDLGLAHQNKTIKYTLEEVKAPEGYTPIAPIEITVQFDQYGRIIQMTDNSFRADCYLDSDTGKSHNMIFNVSNGTIEPQYSVKVVSVDSQTGIRINDSIFYVEVTDSEGTTFKEVTGKTRDVIKTVGNVTFASERGVMKVSGIKAEGDIKISLNQLETATGYVYGSSNKVAGEVLAHAEFIPSTTNLEDDLKLTVQPNSGFEVTVDNTNREIIIKVKNDPELTFDITKIDGKTKEKLANAEFTVTSVLQTSATTVPTTLNETSKLTDENGHTTANGGMVQAGRTMIYTLKENKLEGYQQLDDIILLVQYDTKGKILYYEILSDENDARVINDKEQAKILETKRILQGNDVQGKVELEAQTYSIPTGIGTRVIQLEVSNKKEAGNENDEYQIVIEKHHIDDELYPYFIPGVVFEITVKQEYGKAETKWIDTTNEEGIITSPYFDGYGNITVQIKELETIDGFKLDATVKTLKFKRNKEKHELELISLDPENIGYGFSDDKSKIIMKPVNDVSSNTYNMVLNKIDKNTNMLITNNSAEFEIYRIDKYETLTPVENEETGDITYDSSIQEIKQLVTRQRTNASGRITANNLLVPDEEGTYRYLIKETKAPEGYILPTEDIELDVTFTKNAAEELIITNVIVVKGEGRIKIAKVKDKIMSLIVSNTNGQDVVQDGEYALNILKVDKDKNPITTDTAIFKLTDTQTNEVNYYETNEQGKLEIPTFKMPEEEGKYIYKLNEVKAPNGYVLNVNDIMLELEFAKDEEGKMYLKDVQVKGDNIEYEAPEEGNLPDTTITVKVLNEEGGSGTGNTNDKRYTFVLNKVDSETKEIITKNVEFEIMLANGEIVKGKTNDKGQLRIEDVFMPAKPGEYELVIKEITTPSGYKVDSEPKTVKVTFTGYGENMVISDIKLGDTNNKNIEILQDKCSEQYIEVNILNEKDDYEKLYVISKRYHEGYDLYDTYLKDKNAQSQIYKDGEEIYQVLDGFYGVEGYKNPHYTIDKPFIDTKIAKYKSYVLAEEFIGNLESNGHMEVLGYDGNPIGPKDHVGTGMTLRSTLGDQELTFTIVVKGDADYKDGEKTKTQIGRVSTPDLDKLIMHIAKEKIITDPIALRALDIDFDGRVRNTDLDKMYTLLGGSVYYDYFQNGIDKSDIPYIKP